MSSFDYRRFYDRAASWYEKVVCVLPMWRRYVRESLAWLPDKGDVLEVGSGPGLLMEEIARGHAFVVGLDLSRGMLGRAQKRLRRAGLAAHLIQADASHLPFRDSRFDGIVMTFVFSAIPDGVGTMRELARVLRPNGILVLVDACVPDDSNLPARALARLWTLFGDFMRDEAALMRASSMEVIARREFGIFRGIRLVVGRKLIPKSLPASGCDAKKMT